MELTITWENITVGKFNWKKPRLTPELELLTKFYLGSVCSSPKLCFNKFQLNELFSSLELKYLTHLDFGSLYLSPISKLPID